MNPTRSPLPPLCISARSGAERRKPPRFVGCSVDRHPPPERSWADAATSAQLHTTPARARAEGVSAPAKISNPRAVDNPVFVTSSYHATPAGVTPEIWGHPGALILFHAVRAVARTVAGLASWRAAAQGGGVGGLLRRTGDLVFAGSDVEARWRGWSMARRRGGLTRVYRDPLFDWVVRCPHCRGTGMAMAESRCAPCDGTGRLALC